MVYLALPIKNGGSFHGYVKQPDGNINDLFVHTDRTGQKKNRTSTNDSTHGPVSNYQSPPSTDSCNTAGEQLSLSRSEWAIKSVAQTIPSCC